MPRQKQFLVVGTLIENVKQMDVENARKVDDFEIKDRNEWKKRTESRQFKTYKKKEQTS